MQVDIYRNLHAKTENERWSVRVGGKVIGHCSAWSIPNGAFTISRGGYNTMKKMRCRYVFAWVRGIPARLEGFVPSQKRPDCQELQEAAAALDAPVPRFAGARVRLDWSYQHTFEQVRFVRVLDGEQLTTGALVRGLPDGSCLTN